MQYFDFPASREAFAAGQKDARPFEMNGCYFRERGRTRRHLTLLSYRDPDEAGFLLALLKTQGAKLQTVNFTGPQPDLYPTRPGPIEWTVPSGAGVIDALPLRKRSRARGLASLVTNVSRDPPMSAALYVFRTWVNWAKGRHFMVFKGHYEAWIHNHYFRRHDTHLALLVTPKGQAIFGWEVHNGEAQVTIAKHTPEFKGKTLWLAGLQLIGDYPVHCGSTADDLKGQLGMTPTRSWVYDLKALP